LRTRDGRVVTGVNIDAYLGRMAVCAEAVAIGRAITEAGDQGIETIVAVRHPKPDEPDQTIAVGLPAAQCREIICDYDASGARRRDEHSEILSRLLLAANSTGAAGATRLPAASLAALRG